MQTTRIATLLVATLAFLLPTALPAAQASHTTDTPVIWLQVLNGQLENIATPSGWTCFSTFSRDAEGFFNVDCIPTEIPRWSVFTCTSATASATVSGGSGTVTGSTTCPTLTASCTAGPGVGASCTSTVAGFSPSATVRCRVSATIIPPVSGSVTCAARVSI